MVKVLAHTRLKDEKVFAAHRMRGPIPNRGWFQTSPYGEMGPRIREDNGGWG